MRPAVRRFLLLAHRVPVDGAFTLNDLSGGGGRMDEVARVASTAFTLSNELRRDTELTILFVAAPPPRARRVHMIGSRLRFLHPDERSTAALIKNALVRSIPLDRDVEASPGLVVGPVDPRSALERFASEPGALWLDEGGRALAEWPGAGDGFAAVVSDPSDPTSEERAVLEGRAVPRVSLGPRSLRASQCVDVLHNEFDRRASRGAPSVPDPRL